MALSNKKVPEKDIIKKVDSTLKDLMKFFELDAKWTITTSNYENREGKVEEFVSISVEGENLGVLIGYLGKNLRALQKLVALMVNRAYNGKLEEEDYIRVVIDVSGYRQKREDSLCAMAKRVRDEVLSTGEPVDMPAMTGFERRVVHLCLEEYGDVATESFGEGVARHVRVSPLGEPKTEE